MATYAAMFVLIYWLREHPSPTVTNLFEFRCQLKQPLTSQCKICVNLSFTHPFYLRSTYQKGNLSTTRSIMPGRLFGLSSFNVLAEERILKISLAINCGYFQAGVLCGTRGRCKRSLPERSVEFRDIHLLCRDRYLDFLHLYNNKICLTSVGVSEFPPRLKLGLVSACIVSP